MKLIELLSLISDYSRVEIYSAEDLSCLGEYNGKDSIDTKYNDFNITEIYTRKDCEDAVICIIVD